MVRISRLGLDRSKVLRSKLWVMLNHNHLVEHFQVSIWSQFSSDEMLSEEE